MEREHRGKLRRVWGAALLSVMLFVLTAVPFTVQATAHEAAAIIANENANRAVDAAKEVTKMTLVQSIFTGIVNLLTFAMNRLAYDAAVMLASGGPDEQPLVEYRSAENFFADYGAAVAGEALGLLNTELAAAGGILSEFNLCSPSTPEILLSLKLGIKSAFRRPEPSCDILEIKENWDGFLAQLTIDEPSDILRNEILLTELKDAFDPQTNEFSVGIQLYSDILGRSQQESDIFKDKLLFNGPTKDVVDFITGNIKTPAEYIDYQAGYNMFIGPEETSRNIVLTTLANTDALLQVGVSAASVFTNTFLSEMTNKLYDGLFDFDDVDTDPFDDGMYASSTREDAQERFSSILSVSPLEVTDYDILAEFGSCPSEGRGLYNCVMDSSFLSAVARAELGTPLTLAEAVEEGLIDGDWPLIPSDDQARDQDPYCYTYGYCHSNLVKLRRARVISVGWELAAESTSNPADDPKTLQEVMDGFNDCNEFGERNDSHPWCKLIDPNWVLKYPATQCRALVYGQLLVTDSGSSRQEECVDMPSCIAEDEDGTCSGGYGYCVREENTWRFRGDSCPEYYASCVTFEDADGENASYLLNTVDYGVCDESNAGCLWYATEKEEGDDGAFAWGAVDDVETADETAGAYRSRIYFTADVEECDEEDGGCAELYERDDDVRLNLLPNPSFEDYEDTDIDVPEAWYFTDTSATTYDVSDTYARTGDAAVNAGTGIVYQSGITLEQGRYYTLSYYARQDTSATGVSSSMVIAFANEDDATETVDLTGTDYEGDCALYGTNTDILEVSGTPEGETYERFTCTFTSPYLEDTTDQLYAYVDVMAGDVWVDDVQLELGEDVSDYHEGYSETPSSIVAKVPPAYLGCTGGDDDPSECDNYAQVCSETAIGCTQYSPSNGDPDVFGIADETDECPAACAGYDTFRQEPTRYEPEGEFPVYFIPDSAQQCEEEEVGCDEFTRLDDESLAYFSYVRACVTEDQAAANTNGDQQATFYTWEGSDLEGYQLVTWSLLESDMDGYTSITYTDLASDGTTIPETNPGSAPCTSSTTGEDGITCNDDVEADIGHFDTDSEDCNEHDDIFDNPNCREFYDVDGYVHYRDWSYTVTVNDDCTSFRKTNLAGLNEDSNGDGTADNLGALNNCTDSGGYFDASTSTCRYYGYEDESTTCKESANGCREYTGGRSRNSRVVIEETFEDGDLTNWEAASATDVTYSNESVATDGHSLASAGENVWSYLYDYGTECEEADTGEGCAATTTGTLGGDCTVEDGDEFCGTLVDELYTGKTYTLSFWAKGTGTIEVGFDIGANPAAAALGTDDPTFGDVELSASGWEEYQLGPLNIDEDDYDDIGDDTVLVFVPDSGVTFYVDNIVLREGEDDITVIKDSWVTPAACDETSEGVASSQYYLGCQEYTTHEGELAYLMSFSSLCSEDAVGCTGYFATHESESPYAQVYGASCATLDGAAATSATDCYMRSASGSYDDTSPYLCTIGVAQSSCTFDMDWYIPTDIMTSSNGMDHLSYGPSTHIVPADTSHALVVDDDDECDDDTAGCTELGLPTFSQDRASIAASETVYLLNTPDDYDEVLCSHEELFCAAWESNNDGTFYFEDPFDHVCEYRTDVTIDGTTYDGWFREGVDEFCYGTCTEGGTACSSDADCDSGDTCDTTDPSYVIGGDQSGMWLNGDDGYGGWAGSCEETYDGCSEFQDLLDIDEEEGDVYGQVDGTSYYYLDNETLEESVLPSSQQCNGQVSQKLGCGIFRDTTDSSLDYNASASYVASAHADALFGDAPFALVDPIDCDNDDSTMTAVDGTEVDLCAQRCAYANRLVYDLTADYDDRYTFGTSCYVDDDCQPLVAESGDNVEGTCESSYRDGTETYDVTRLENDVNRVLKVNRDRQCSEWLSCSDTQTVWDATSASYKTVCGDISLCDEYSADGDASFCSSWNNDGVAAVLDINRYSSRDVSWYGAEYSGYAIPDMFPVEVLTQSIVTPPSGYCDMSQITHYSDGTDASDTYDYTESDYHGAACDTDADCVELISATADAEGDCIDEDDEEYNLVFNAGSCDEDYGESCTVGYCATSGESCASADECGEDDGSCVLGECRYLDDDSSCFSDADCDDGTYTTCYQGTCGYDGGDIAIGGFGVVACESDGGTVAYSVLTKTGTCVRESCLLAKDGTALNVDEGEPKTCRAYPEENSPFANEVVEEWFNPDRRESTNAAPTYFTADLVDTVGGENAYSYGENAPDAIPYDYVSGFEGVETCQLGEACSCSYNKVSYGESATATTTYRYFGESSVYVDRENIGVCVGGDFDGAYCTDDGTFDATTDEVAISVEDCEDGDGSTYDGGGECLFPTREDRMLGMEGYCLERDTAINVNGNRDDDHRACLTWLPVDQLAGSTDLYAKYTSAGFFEDAYICTDVRPYADVRPTRIRNTGSDGTPSEGDVACAESGEGGNVTWRNAYDSYIFTGDSSRDGCFDNAVCPDGFWTLMGQPTYDGSHDTYADACTGDGAIEVNDCPYMCVPYGAYTLDASEDIVSCDPTEPYVEELLTTYADADGWDFDGSAPSGVYVIGHAPADSTDTTGEERFDSMADALTECRAVGVEYSDGELTGDASGQNFLDDLYNFPASTAIANGDTYGYCVYTTDACDTADPETYCGTGSCSDSDSDGIDECVQYSGGCDDNGDCGSNGYCSDSPEGNSGSSGYRWLYSELDIYPACKEATQVAEDSGTYKSFVWTDRLLNASAEGGTITGGSDALAYISSHAPAYFGMTIESPASRGESEPPFQVATCDSADGETMSLPSGITECGSGESTSVRDFDDRNDPESPEARSWISFSFVDPDSYSAGGSSGRTVETVWSDGIGDTGTLYERFNQIIAWLSFNGADVWEWTGGQTGVTADEESDVLNYEAQTDSTGSPYDVRATAGSPPTVWALGSCEGEDCTEGEEDALTLNSDASGEQEAEEFFRAYLKFFAAADKNQLPIRRVIVDWQDGSDQVGSSANDNFYKNHRGLEGIGEESICASEDEWGMTSGSCDADYFSYSHIYTCSRGDVAGLDACETGDDGYVSNAPCTQDSACVYRPRVHIRDNWGWCTGTCTSGDDETDGCFEGTWGGSESSYMTTSDEDSECAYTVWPNSSLGDNDPWVYYDGQVVVTP